MPCGWGPASSQLPHASPGCMLDRAQPGANGELHILALPGYFPSLFLSFIPPVRHLLHFHKLYIALPPCTPPCLASPIPHTYWQAGVILHQTHTSLPDSTNEVSHKSTNPAQILKLSWQIMLLLCSQPSMSFMPFSPTMPPVSQVRSATIAGLVATQTAIDQIRARASGSGFMLTDRDLDSHC